MLITPGAIEGVEGSQPGHDDVTFPSLDGTVLQARYWGRAEARGVLLIAHGLGEHGGSYRRTAEALVTSLDVGVLAFDFRGSGRSPGKRGVVRDYADLCRDLDAANRWAAKASPDLPRFLLGHSNGGLVAIRTVLEHDLGLTGLILSNPSLEVTARVPAWKLLVANVLLRVAPWVTLTTGLENEQLTHDPELMAEIDADPLRHSRISPPLYFGMKSTAQMVMGRASEIRVPTLMILGGSDPIINPESCRSFFERLGAEDKTLKIYPEMRHEPLNELGRRVVQADLASWLEPRLPSRNAETNG